MDKRGISIVIPTWNGKHILAEFLPSVIEACRVYKGESEILVVDDGSTDDTVEFLNNNFPRVSVKRLEQNRGYGYACNYGIEYSRYDLVVLLNNDVLVKDDFLTYLLIYFDKEDVFAVRIRVFRMQDKEAIENGSFKPETVWIRGEFKFGFISYPAKKTCVVSETPRGAFSFSVGAGAFAFDKRKWFLLGGFDPLFYPFYAEETDIAYRALKRGWKIIYEPKSAVYHKGKGFTISKSKRAWYINLIGERNRYFLVWKNITDLGMIFKHICFIPLRLLRNLFTGNLFSFFAFFYALLWLPKVLKIRAVEKKEAKLRDKDIFSFFSLPK